MNDDDLIHLIAVAGSQQNELDEQTALLQEAAAMLKRLEWLQPFDAQYQECPICHRVLIEVGGHIGLHTSDCELNSLLIRLSKEN